MNTEFTPKIKTTFIDANPQVCAALEAAFKDTGVNVVNNILNRYVHEAPPADYIITAGNSFGIMDGGFDYYIRDIAGQSVQDALQWRIVYEFGGQLPVGEAAIINTGNRYFPYLVYAPTMETPRKIGIHNVYSALCAAYSAIKAHCAVLGKETAAIVCPAFGTGAGEVNFFEAAEAMKSAFSAIVGV